MTQKPRKGDFREQKIQKIAHKTYQLWKRKARVLDFRLPTIRPLQKNFFKQYFFSGILGFGVPFSINFPSSSAFWDFRKPLEQNAMSSSVTGQFLNTGEIWFSYITILYVMFFSYVNFQLSQKSHCYQLHWDTLFQECFWSRSINSRVGIYRGIKPQGEAEWLCTPRKPSRSFIKHYLMAALRREFPEAKK